jgi:hypothetical protein
LPYLWLIASFPPTFSTLAKLAKFSKSTGYLFTETRRFLRFMQRYYGWLWTN